MAFDVGAVVAHIKADLTDFKKGMDEANNKVDSFGNSMAKIGAGVADFGAKAAVFTGVVAAGAGLIAKVGLEGAAKFEQYQVAFTTLLGSQEKAAAAIKSIQADAAKTPFELAPLVMANQRLISAGINAEDARADILNLGDAISATGGGNAELERLSTNLQQIKAVGKASALDIKQFAFAGINIYEMLAKSTGKTVDQVKEMDVSYEVLADAFDKAAGKGGMFHDAMKTQSRTLNGLMSTLRDTITLGLKDILMNSGAFDVIRTAVENLIPFLDALVPKIVAFFQAIPQNPAVIAVFNALSVVFNQLVAWISANQELVLTFLKGLAIGLGALLVIGTITMLVTALLNPLTLVVLAIAALYTAWETNFFGIRDITMAVITEVMAFFNNFLMPAFQIFVDWFTARWDYIKLMVRGAWEIIKGVIMVAWAIIYGFLTVGLALMQGDWAKAWEAIKHSVAMAWEGIKSIFSGIINFIIGWGGTVLNELVRPFQDAWNRISDFVNKIKDALDFTKRHSPSVVDIIKKGVSEVNRALGGLELDVNSPSSLVSNMAAGSQSNSMTNVQIDMSGAYINDPQFAQQIGEQIGDSIIKKLQMNVRF